MRQDNYRASNANLTRTMLSAHTYNGASRMFCWHDFETSLLRVDRGKECEGE